ncbi:unnamed protein product [Diamesa serratosioi]
MNRFLCVVALCALSASAQKFQCPVKNGQYEDSVQCDKFYECTDGVAKERLCPDGLVFDEGLRKVNKCDQPFNIDCGDRTELQAPRPKNDYCPRRNGFFAHPDPAICNIFYNCIDGEYIENKCTGGLHFDEYSGTCVWPDAANREGCNPELKELKDGFNCPKGDKKNDESGQIVAHPHYPHPTDCQKFYVCLSGIDPRELGCSVGEVYNEETKRCDAPENVPGCEDWYKDAEKNK